MVRQEGESEQDYLLRYSRANIARARIRKSR
jgi:hypothetical protein